MTLIVSQIKLYGPGIPLALTKLNEFAAELMTGIYREVIPKIKQARPYIGEDADYEFLWEDEPSIDETLTLIKQLDMIFLICQVKYTITTISPLKKDLINWLNQSGAAFTFIRLIGPEISLAIEALNELTKTPELKGTGFLIGNWDYAIEWTHIPTLKDITGLLEKLDQALKGTGTIYKCATKSKLKTHSAPNDHELLKKDRPLRMQDPTLGISIDTK